MKSITHGTCALNGRHMSEAYAAECPMLGRNPAERISRFRTGGVLRPGNQGAHTTIPGTPESPSKSLEESRTSHTVFRHGRAGRSGRPRVPESMQRRKHADRSRVYRQRTKAARIAASDAAVSGAAA